MTRSTPAPTARIATCGGLMIASNRSHAEHPEVRDRERAAGDFLARELPGAGALGEIARPRLRSGPTVLVSAARTIGVTRPPSEATATQMSALRELQHLVACNWAFTPWMLTSASARRA